ncbi:hypothetical protein BCR34DRAFT_591630 [Clohesyomyces aquaticus]|uniref:Uncharacterized protein n=1 Tax=Clohesyomyces aquaticus TaxID=1231657 RepID=A0A1Y1Z065_9PLEO|nr:hypothetical protein BCR34DRAFT_591630 [Clohesyomyces aquaticus]
MNGRQLSCYIGELKRREQDLLQPFLTEPENFDRLDDLQAVLRRLRAVETHVDLLEPLTASSSQNTSSFDQVQWAVTNCVKFKFLSELFDNLRDTDTHILIVIEKENNELFDILEKFCEGKRVGYKYPARAHASDLAKVKGALRVTMMLLDSNPVIRPPDAIICLDGNIDTAQIRKKRWALHPDRSNVAIIHLVIPRTIGHIERYVSPALSLKRRLHTIVASLAQVERDIGRPMTSSPGDSEPAEHVAEFLRSFDEDGSQAHIEWPLHSIGSIKDVIEFQSEQSQMSISSPPSNGGTSSKRPLDEEYLDSSKRMRMTPTPQATAQVDITHISDSMPSTAIQVTKLQAQLEQERKAHKQTMRLKREFENALDKSRTQLEDLQKRHKVILAEAEAEKKKADLAVRHKQNLQDRYEKRGEDMLELRAKLQEHENVAVSSEDEKIAEIARLMKELREVKEEAERAEAKAASAENLRNYMQEQYSDARERATQLNDEKIAAESERDAYKQQADVTHVDLKKLHIDDSTKQVMRQVELLRTQKKQMEKLLQQKEDEITKMRTAKGVGMGTRAASVPRSPRVGAGGVTSRGASPLPGGRISNLRNG